MKTGHNTRSGDTAKTWLMVFAAPIGIGAYAGSLYPGGHRAFIARIIDVTAPWLLAAALLTALAVMVKRVVSRRRSGHGGGFRAWWRGWWRYRRRWTSMMTLLRLVTRHDDHTLIPRLRHVRIARDLDLLAVGMVKGQVPGDWEARSEALAHAFGAESARVSVLGPGVVRIALRYTDTLARPIPLPARPASVRRVA